VLVPLLIVGALVVVALAVAWWLERARDARATPVAVAAAPTAAAVPVPAQLARADFPRPGAPWLVVLFSSDTCAGCAAMAEKVRALESADVAVFDAEFGAQRALHERYGVEAVPIVVIVDAEGVTRASFAGSASATDLWAKVAELRAGAP
jgi:hypothetical protein